MKVYFTSDTHYWHKSIIEYADRPFRNSFDGMICNAKTMFDNYNAIVKDEDVVFHLGDLAFINKSNKCFTQELCKQLHGTKILIKGNHDRCSDEFYYNCGFSLVLPYLVIGRYFITHYPLETTFCGEEKRQLKIFQQNKCDTIICGHVHNRDISKLPDGIKRINTCVDFPPNDFKPVKSNSHTIKNWCKSYLKSIETNQTKKFLKSYVYIENQNDLKYSNHLKAS